ncbi:MULTISPECIES: hypothetical protein [unclassified Micromonospora]|uniref:hypothetical protein n=1 Tax=unclassified Micromonospora TaxID=2617518 RepID=UPI00259C9C08|nr:MULTISPECIES: hypothetical protein [unclassified Micromonospora]MDM4783697.1 hypothetical protein [Micromonospora sp. b486]
MIRERLSALAVVPDDVTDPLLWRLALDVAAAHQPNEHGDCRNLQCAGQRGMCAAARHARRAMTLARRPRLVVAPPRPTRDNHRVVREIDSPTLFGGWFASANSPAPTGGGAQMARAFAA